MTSISLKIRILDKEYQVNCAPEEREALEYSAKLLNEKMEDIRRGSHIIGLERIAVMAALNLAHDLIQKSVKVIFFGVCFQISRQCLKYFLCTFGSYIS